MDNKEHRFFKCEICGNITEIIEASGVPIYCCGEEMSHLKAENPTFSIRVDNVSGKVTVDLGEKAKECDWVYLQTNVGGQRKRFNDKGIVEFTLWEKEDPEQIFAYSTVFGLLRVQI